MVIYRGVNMTLENAGTTISPGGASGTVRCFSETYDMSTGTVTTSDTLEVGVIPKGAVFLYGVISNTATLATSTVALGITGSVAKYRAALIKTTILPEVFGVGAALGAVTTAEETVFATIAVASLPTSGTLSVSIFYAYN